MKKDMIFFTADGVGLTSTSANHIANLAKEMIRNLEFELSELTLYSTDVALIGSSNVSRLSNGVEPSTLDEIVGKLHRVADAKSLIAWLREAIKAKERMLGEAEALTLDDYAKEQGITLDPKPERPKTLTDDDFYARLSVDERCRYYRLEALAATLGLAVHPPGALAEARSMLQRRLHAPREVKGEGRDTLIYTYTPSVDSEAVDQLYFLVQKQFREEQARLNTIKHECARAVHESAIAILADHAKAVEQWNANRQLLEARLAEHIKRSCQEISSLKIIIPEQLRPVYDEVASLGKNKTA